MKAPFNYDLLVNEIYTRQNCSWNNGRINNYMSFPEIEACFDFINQGDGYDVGYKGDLFRIHTVTTGIIDFIDPNKYDILNEPDEEDGSCSILSKTNYDGKIVAFSKSYDFTKEVYYKVYPEQICNIIHINTGDMYGIDINTIITNERLEDEQEVLFPLDKKYLVKEYKHITPAEFKKIMDSKFNANQSVI